MVIGAEQSIANNEALGKRLAERVQWGQTRMALTLASLDGRFLARPFAPVASVW